MAGPPSEELLDELHHLREELDETSSSTDMNNMGEYWTSTYQDHFGSWNNALREAGFEPNQARKIPTDDLLNELTRLARNLNKTPTRDQMDEMGKYYGKSYRRRFGSWSDAVRQAGLEPDQRIPESEFRDRPDMCPLCGTSADEFDFHHWRYGENKAGCYFCRDCHDRIHAGGARPEEDADWLLKAVGNLLCGHMETHNDRSVETIVEQYNIPSKALVECVISDVEV